jgi:uncharacterized protein YodC (DUF2158 family)
MAGKDTFKVGDLVILKSGGPVMTILSVGGRFSSEADSYHCGWFSGKKNESDYFPHNALNPAPKDEAKS